MSTVVPLRGAQTALRAIAIIDAVAQGNGPMTVPELARICQANPSAVYRMVRALTSQGFLARDARGQGVVIGNGLIGLASQILRNSSLRDLARPNLQELARATNETVSLHVRHLRNRICIDGIESPHPIRRAAFVGQSLPLYAGPTGKAILAFLDPDETAEILAWAKEQGQDMKRIGQHLDQARDKGYLALVNDRTEGVGGLSAPIMNGAKAVGAITISGPADRFTPDIMEAAAPLLVRACASLTWAGSQLPIAAQP